MSSSRLIQTSIAAAALVAAATVSAQAADMPVKAAPYYPPAVESWTGFYVGGFVGAGWGTDSATLNSITITGVGTTAIGLPLAQVSNSGFLGGGQIGYNYQSGWMVWGIEADIAGTDIKGSAPCVILFTCSAKDNWLATASARVGGLVGDRTLVYVKGGGAWLNETGSLSAPFGLFTTSSTNTSAGWLVGMGAEYKFTHNWSGVIEYDYMDFGTQNNTYPIVPGVTASVAETNKLSTMKVGLNYKW
jgi:outer membrane immunogenic protein